MEIEKKIEGLAKGFEDFKKENDKRIAEIEKKGAASSETIAAVEKANADVSKLSDEVKAVQTAMNRTAQGAEGKAVSAEEMERKDAFNKYVRKGTETKALSAQSDENGGYFVIPEMSNEIVQKVFESSPIRQYASVQAISTDSLEILEDLDEAAASWVTEVGTRSSSATPVLKKIVIAVHEQYAMPLASQKILDDAMVNVESWLGGKVADKFARTENTAFVLGSGVGQPRGFMTYAAGTTGFNDVQQVNSGSAAVITADGLISLFYALKAPYRANSSFMMNRATVASVRKLKDSQNRYIWEPSLVAGSPDMLFGRPVVDAADIAVEGANNLVIACGDFKAAYQIVDRFGIRVLRDPYSSKPYVAFYTTKRVGGDVKNFEAIKIQKCST